MMIRSQCKVLEYSVKLNWGSSPSEYVQLASQAGGGNRTESAGGFPGAGQGPALRWQWEAREGAAGRSEAGVGHGEHAGDYSRGTVEIKGNYDSRVL